nr:hypothetical protein TetV2_00428 [Oceanusvirus sp.]
MFRPVSADRFWIESQPSPFSPGDHIVTKCAWRKLERHGVYLDRDLVVCEGGAMSMLDFGTRRCLCQVIHDGNDDAGARLRAVRRAVAWIVFLAAVSPAAAFVPDLDDRKTGPERDAAHEKLERNVQARAATARFPCECWGCDDSATVAEATSLIHPWPETPPLKNVLNFLPDPKATVAGAIIVHPSVRACDIDPDLGIVLELPDPEAGARRAASPRAIVQVHRLDQYRLGRTSWKFEGELSGILASCRRLIAKRNGKN